LERILAKMVLHDFWIDRSGKVSLQLMVTLAPQASVMIKVFKPGFAESGKEAKPGCGSIIVGVLGQVEQVTLAGKKLVNASMRTVWDKQSK
jgi:hypothetical protein